MLKKTKKKLIQKNVHWKIIIIFEYLDGLDLWTTSPVMYDLLLFPKLLIYGTVSEIMQIFCSLNYVVRKQTS